MAIHYLLDEHIALAYRNQLLRRQPDLRVWGEGEEGENIECTHYESICTSYCSNIRSSDTKVKVSYLAWEINNRSKGSR